MKPKLWAAAKLGSVLALAALGCSDTGQSTATVALQLAGTAASEPIETRGGWAVELTRAELAFGPLYLCAGAQAGSLCDTARLEWLESAVVDVLDPEPRPAGALHGTTGPVRSWMYDLGITSLLTQQRPLVLPAAESLGGNSLRLEGLARRGDQTLAFQAELPIRQEEQAEIGVSVVRKSGSDRFEREITAGGATLTVRFDPGAWLGDVQFDALVPAASAEPLLLAPETQAYRALRGALTAGARPTFEWSDTF